jgi:Ricin-type beta-trefoil lectin domain/Putative Ig domain
VRFRALLTGCAVIAAISASAFITPAVATAATTRTTTTAAAAAAKPTIHPLPAARIPGVTVRTLNLHSQFEHALASGHQRMSGTQYSGMATATPSATATRSATSAAASCTEPKCPMSNHGGPVQHSPKVYVVLWGPGWNTTDTTSNDYIVESYLLAMYFGLGQTSYDSWSTITSQYGDTTGHPTFSGSVLAPKFIIDTSTPPGPVTPQDIATEAATAADSSNFNITDPDNSQVVVAFESGVCFSDGFAGSCGTAASSGYCAWHAALTSTTGTNYLPFVNLPWQLDNTGCGAGFVNGSQGGLDGWSISGGHEYAESITDPVPPTGWIDTADTVSSGEVGDKCAFLGKDPYANVTLPIGTQNNKVVTFPFAMQSLWSNAAGRCVLTSSPQLSVTRPATQKSTLGKSVSLQVKASTNTHYASTFRASGLPAGLSINASSGKITGKPSVTAGTFTPKVTVSDYAKTVSVTFTWQVTSAAGQVKGPSSKCLDDASGKTANGTRIDLWGCLNQSRQKVTFNYSGELAVVGKCVTLANSRSTTLTLQPCKAASNQKWKRGSSGEYVLATNGRCLTAPRTSNGTQLTVAACKNSSSQHWSLP